MEDDRRYCGSVVVVAMIGNIGSGKSSAAAVLAEKGAKIVDSDEIVRRMQQPNTRHYKEIVDNFGQGVVGDDGSLDRQALAAIVFADSEALHRLEAIMHPAVRAEISKLAKKQQGTNPSGLIVFEVSAMRSLDAYEGIFHKIVWIKAPAREAFKRVNASRGIGRIDFEARLRSQPSENQLLAVSDYIIDNRGNGDQLCRSLDICWSWMLRQ